MKSVFASVIARGGYDLSAMLAKIDTYHIAGRLTDTERDELYAMARGGADALAEMDVRAKLAELEQRVTALESGGASSGETAEEYPKYVPGKWYYRGAKTTHAGKRYICCAPDGVVCTWSPDEYPAYWETVGE